MTHTPRFHRVDMPWRQPVTEGGYTELHSRMTYGGIAGAIKLQMYLILRDYLSNRLIDGTDTVRFEFIWGKLL